MPVAFAAPPQVPPQSYRPAYSEYCRAYSQTTPSPIISFLDAELHDVFAECHLPDWDGYGAEAVTAEAFEAAQRFAAALPAGLPMPSVGADPDGCFTFVWRSGKSKTLLVSVSPKFRIDFAAVFGASRVFGNEAFFDKFPPELKGVLSRVLG